MEDFIMLAMVIWRAAKLGFKANQKGYVCGNRGMIYEIRVMVLFCDSKLVGMGTPGVWGSGIWGFEVNKSVGGGAEERG
jgi:hypothetical protein